MANEECASAACASTAPMLRECKLNRRCGNKTDPDLCNCWEPSCSGLIHCGCCKMLLDRFEVPVGHRPSLTEKTELDEPAVFCEKGCYTKWVNHKKKEAKMATAAAALEAKKAAQKKQRVPWEDDGTLDVLMDWLTTEGNCADYCGANDNKGKTKTQQHKEIASLLLEKLPHSNRTEKNVENEITSLERQFRKASDWANDTGQGVENERSFEDTIEQRCPLHRTLEPAMGDRPNAKPLATNDSTDEGEDDEEDHVSVMSGVADTAVLKSLNDNDAAGEEDPREETPSTLTSNTEGTKRRLTASTASSSSRKTKRGKAGGNELVDGQLTSLLGLQCDNGDTTGDSYKQLRIREVSARETEASARMMEATAMRDKSQSESDILQMQAKAAPLRERKKPQDEGVAQEDTDLMLPLPKQI